MHLCSHTAQVSSSPQDGGMPAPDVLSCPSLDYSSPPASPFCRETGGHRCPRALALVLFLEPSWANTRRLCMIPVLSLGAASPPDISASGSPSLLLRNTATGQNPSTLCHGPPDPAPSPPQQAQTPLTDGWRMPQPGKAAASGFWPHGAISQCL